MERSLQFAASFVRAAFGAAAAIFAGYWLFFGWLVFTAPLSYAELDLDHDGSVSFSEADYAASFGERALVVGNRQCKEYFAYKDGLPLKVICPRPV